MDTQLLAMRNQIINQLVPLIQKQRAELKSHIERVDQSRKSQEETLHQKIKQLQRKIKKINPVIQNHREELEFSINRVNENRKAQERTLNMEINRIIQRIEEEGPNKDLSILQRKYQQQQKRVQKLVESLSKMNPNSNPPQKRKYKQKEEFNKSKTQKKKCQLIKPIISPKLENLRQYSFGEDGRVERVTFRCYDDGDPYQQHPELFGNIPIAEKNINQFKIIGEKNRDRNHYCSSTITLGIIDSKYMNRGPITKYQWKQVLKFYQIRECIFYTVQIIYPPKTVQQVIEENIKKKKAKTIPVMDEQTIIMEVEGQTIWWRVGEQTRAKCTNPMITDSSINWVPFINLNSRDAVRWQ